MARTFTVTDFFRRFPDDDSCLDHLMAVRFGHEAECPKCGRVAKFYRIRKEPAYACGHCGHHVHPMQGTPFALTRTPLQKWFYAMYLFTTSRHGVSAMELQRQLGVTYKTAWRMGHEIRKYMAKVDGDPRLHGIVEADESYLGGRVKGRKKHGVTGRGANKTIVFGMVQRGGDVIARVVETAGGKSLLPHINTHIAKRAVIATDEWQGYARVVKNGYIHLRCDHGREEWVRGGAHTNTIEAFWGIIKRSIRSTHIHVSRKHLPSYLGEFEFRWNLRKAPQTMFHRLLTSF